ncbi:hypothetical protein PENNAL_c0005G08222 [Penicillium nalgiovense]|uniref:Uncharacterized protein n=1 Tax=Penicillium nalgiovense TaxID=60175 RepID=A0A1V6Z1P5_PENNA|nr:hypothetical protein PENNAL_c0005G08222 [Penicillium nalgiovense]
MQQCLGQIFETDILNEPTKTIPANVSLEYHSLQYQTKPRGPTKKKVSQPENHDIFIHHETDDLILAPYAAIGSPIIGSKPEQHQGHPHPEENKKTMELWGGRPQILKGTQLSGEIQVLEPEFPFLTRLI